MLAATVSPAAVTFFQLNTNGVKRVEALPLVAGGAAPGSGACSAADWLAAACVLLRCQLPLQLQARDPPSFQSCVLWGLSCVPKPHHHAQALLKTCSMLRVICGAGAQQGRGGGAERQRAAQRLCGAAG